MDTWNAVLKTPQKSFQKKAEKFWLKTLMTENLKGFPNKIFFSNVSMDT